MEDDDKTIEVKVTVKDDEVTKITGYVAGVEGELYDVNDDEIILNLESDKYTYQCKSSVDIDVDDDDCDNLDDLYEYNKDRGRIQVEITINSSNQVTKIKEKKSYIEVAFYGGSFTGIDSELQEKLLKVAYEYVKNGSINGIRVSTRPDYINRTILKRLKKYKVKTIELGVQSTNDYILKACKRGHTYEDVVRASKLIRRFRFNLGHQMMVGLPESSPQDDFNTANDLIKLKPKMVRIYPVLVIKENKIK